MEAEVGAVEAGDVHVRLTQSEPSHDVAAHEGVGGGGEGDDGRAAEAGADGPEVTVARAKIMAPLRDAVRLIDGEQGDVHAAHGGDESSIREALRGDVEEAKIASGGAPQDAALLLTGDRGVDRCGGDAVLGERVDLVFHEGEQGRDDEGEAIKKKGGNLVADALTAARWENGERVPPREHGGHDLRLPRKECVVAEDLPQLLAGENEGVWVVPSCGGRGFGHAPQFRTCDLLVHKDIYKREPASLPKACAQVTDRDESPALVDVTSGFA